MLVLLVSLCLPWLVAGSLEIASYEVKGSDSISFDPLAVLAILWNPRASASASRLYAQPPVARQQQQQQQQQRYRYRWPHMMQVGAVTVAVSVLVNHMTMNYRSIHPAVEMFLGDVDKIRVKSTIGNAVNLFTTLPVSGSELALVDSLNFRSSRSPANDIFVVNVGAGAGVGRNGDSNIGVQQQQSIPRRTRRRFFAKLVFLATEVFMGLLISCGLGFSIRQGDPWAIALFGSYLVHWLASTAVSFCHMVTPDENLRIREDGQIVYAVYERQSGGLIVFKGTQSTMETWARTTWTFVNTPLHRCVHWAWMVSGACAALASVANMVNMSGWLQLGFLGMLLYGSAAEVWLTVAGRALQDPDTSFLGPCSSAGVYDRDKKFKSIVQAGLGLRADHCLATLRWTKLGLLPDREPFTALEDVIERLHEARLARADPSTALRASLEHYDRACDGLPAAEQGFVAAMRSEIQRAWLGRVTVVSSTPSKTT